ncbi:MAG TPA: alpha/beta hydrolase [Verrucomicrobiae bacterium]
MKTFLVVVFLLSSFALSQARAQDAIPLWPDGVPGALGNSSNDIPTITPFVPTTNATGAAMVICPGGGYGALSPREGRDYALWLNQHGLTCFVLKYRLGSHGYHYPAEYDDVERSIRWVRAHAAEYRIDSHRVGIMGSSAGGHLASMALTHFDSGDANSPDPVEHEGSRPDLGILCYAVITMGPYTHAGSKKNLLGPNPSQKLVDDVSSELQVTSDTPPCFIWCTYEDKTVPMENSMMFAEALRKHGVPFDLHIYQHGGHGMALADKPPFAHPHPWAKDCLYWLKLHQYVSE